ncbi:hypothetical protein [Candidatus Phytoplasma solani]|uniref:Uncharacterized protein n=1 Tax=Candidatus Phytoplasma solani TaxID=69896 RepID=A0A421NUS3_9MOLU|nr:hypothetical protein [Candidatus Phytoplasma solani]RMI87791.1 hypothetical protein PSSA1_v1c5600 [Candidatus Phytoplasma solani]
MKNFLNFLQVFLQTNKSVVFFSVVLVLLIILGLVAKSLQKSNQSVERIKQLKSKIKLSHNQRLKLAKAILASNNELESITKNLLEEIDVNASDNKEVKNIVVNLKEKELKTSQIKVNNELVEKFKEIAKQQETKQQETKQQEKKRGNNIGMISSTKIEPVESNNFIEKKYDFFRKTKLLINYYYYIMKTVF